jgi:NADPH:quinone reductase
MHTEFNAIVQSEYGTPEKVLRIARRQFNSEVLAADDVLVRVTTRPVHPGDIQILAALPQAGPVVPIPDGSVRVPGLEGVGTIVRLGRNPFRRAIQHVSRPGKTGIVLLKNPAREGT